MKREEMAFTLAVHAGRPAVIVTRGGVRKIYVFHDADAAIAEFELCSGRPVESDQAERFRRSVKAWIN